MKDKVILVTGASGGIGKATALELARRGARLMLASRRVVALSAVEQEIVRNGGVAKFMAVDLRVEEDIRHLVWRTHEEFGRLDVLVNNAAVGFFGSVEKTPLQDADELLNLNFRAPLIAIQEALPIMRRQGSGHIVNISSVAGRRGLPMSGMYCATKFAMVGLSESLRVELKSTGIRVSVVYPSSTETDFFDNVKRGDVQGKYEPIGKTQTAAYVAQRIANCIARPTAEVYPYFPGRVFAWISAVAPSLADRLMMPWVEKRTRRQLQA